MNRGYQLSRGLCLRGCVVWQGFDWGRVGDVIEHESGVQPPQSERGERLGLFWC